jgi:streptogramin lyase
VVSATLPARCPCRVLATKEDRMTSSTKPILTVPPPKGVVSSALVLSLLALGACGNLTEASVDQPIGELALVSSGGGSLTPVPSTTQRTTVTGSGSIGAVTVVSFADGLGQAPDAVAVASDGAPWFTMTGQLLRVAPDDTIASLSMPMGEGYAPAIVSDGLGALWMADWSPVQALGRLDTTTFDLQTYSVPAPLSRPTSVASDGRGGIWLGGGNQPIVGRVDTTNHVFVLADESAPAPVTVSTAGVAIASDGQIFIADYDGGRMGRVQGTSFAWTDLGGTTNAPGGLAAGDDGSVWFVSLGQPNEVGRVAHDGTLQAYPLPAADQPAPGKSLGAIVRGPDGAFWFTLPAQAQLGRVDGSGQLSFIQLDAGSLPRSLAFDPSGRLWFTSVPGFGRIEF